MSVSVRAVLEEGRTLGFLGPGPVTDHIAHSEALRAGLEPAPDSLVDLGSGAGVPGLVLCAAWPRTTAVLIDASARRCDFLRHGVARLGWADRVEIAHGRGEDVAREASYREQAELVVARSFGPPAVVAEIGSALVRLDGRLVVTEPPAADRSTRAIDARWPDAGLAELGLEPAVYHESDHAGFVTMIKRREVPERYPRRVGIPGKRPLWS